MCHTVHWSVKMCIKMCSPAAISESTETRIMNKISGSYNLFIFIIFIFSDSGKK